jgi:uncharacterized protein YqcC (DUF446 family)
MKKFTETQSLLVLLEEKLREADLWQASYPSTEALSSSAPFCCDTLAFEQWLQFVFIPRMQALIDNRAALPSTIAICPMGEEAFKPLGDKASALIDVLAKIDFTLSGVDTRERKS